MKGERPFTSIVLLLQFIQIGDRATLVVRPADAIELGAFGRIQGTLAHGTVVDVGPLAYLCKYNISFWIYRNVDHDSPLFLDRVGRTGKASCADRTSVQVERAVASHAFVGSVVGVAERAALVAGP